MFPRRLAIGAAVAGMLAGSATYAYSWSDRDAPRKPVTAHAAAIGHPTARVSAPATYQVPSEFVPADRLPVVSDPALVKSQAPAVPPPTGRTTPARVVVHLASKTAAIKVTPDRSYEAWTFDGDIPGPMIRARVGDVLEVHHANDDANGLGHNIDFHAVIGPGGGAPALYAEAEETKVGHFRLLHPGLFFYHCAAAPVPSHIANGMYGLLLVEPEEGLPPVDHEFYVVQSEIYAEEDAASKTLVFDYGAGLDEHPRLVVFNGRQGALTEAPLRMQQNSTARIYFANAGPNLISSFHVIGQVFDRVYREGDLLSPPARSVQTTLVPAGGACAVDISASVPGNYTLVDHSIFRLDKGAVGFLKVTGKDARADIYASDDLPQTCPGCKLHS